MDKYWEETQRYLEYEELRYEYELRTNEPPSPRAADTMRAPTEHSFIYPFLRRWWLQHLLGGAGGRHVLLRLQLAGRLHLPLVVVGGGVRQQEHPDGARPPPQAQRQALRAPQRRAEHHQGKRRSRTHAATDRRSSVPSSSVLSALYYIACMQMDKASIIKDAIEYIQQLQAEERRVLQELRVLDDDTAAAATAQVECCDVDGGLLRREAERAKKMKRAQSVASGAQSAPPPPPPPHVEVLELRVSEVGDHVLVVSVTCRKRRDAMARVCRAIEDLRLRVITANVTSVAGCHVHTVFVEVRRRWHGIWHHMGSGYSVFFSPFFILDDGYD
jgi:hypothetical protein